MGQFKSKPNDPSKKETSTKWWMPLFGLVLAITMAVVAVMLAPPLRKLWWNRAPNLRSANDLVFAIDVLGESWGKVDLGLAFMIWLVMFAIAMFAVIAIVGGQTEKDKLTKQVMLDAQRKKEAEKRRKKKGRRKR